MLLYIVLQLTGISEALSGQASTQPLGWLKMLTLDARLGSTKVAKCVGGGVDGKTSLLTVVILWGFVSVCVWHVLQPEKYILQLLMRQKLVTDPANGAGCSATGWLNDSPNHDEPSVVEKTAYVEHVRL